MHNIGYIEKEEFSKKVNTLLIKRKYKTLEKILALEIKNQPQEYWLLTTMANVLYEQKMYKKALSYAKEAFKIAGDDPLVLYDYAPILKMNGNIKEAIKYWTLISRMSKQRLAFGKYGEGIRWAKSIKNNVNFHLAMTYKEMGDLKNFKKYLKKNIAQRGKGIPCNYTKKEAVNLYKRFFENA